MRHSRLQVVIRPVWLCALVVLTSACSNDVALQEVEEPSEEDDGLLSGPFCSQRSLFNCSPDLIGGRWRGSGSDTAAFDAQTRPIPSGCDGELRAEFDEVTNGANFECDDEQCSCTQFSIRIVNARFIATEDCAPDLCSLNAQACDLSVEPGVPPRRVCTCTQSVVEDSEGQCTLTGTQEGKDSAIALNDTSVYRCCFNPAQDTMHLFVDSAEFGVDASIPQFFIETTLDAVDN